LEVQEYLPGNIAPRILARSEHVVSRRNIDEDALKVLYRLKNNGFVAYLVGGGVRDLLLERAPKDFDIATSAHPAQVKRLFRNCFIVGRRFWLAHVRFGKKVIEVSTFRKAAEPEEGDTLIRRDNTFGTPEEDAFRRDFTVNALFYDIATFSVIDWVGGLADVQDRVIRSIGDPGLRFREDPVRMLRAVALAARLGFTIDRDAEEAIRALRGEIVRSSPARVLEEIYKILRQGRARQTFQDLHRHGLLAYLMPEAAKAMGGGGTALLESLDRLDRYRASGVAAEQLTNPILVGTLLVPLGVPLNRVQGSKPRRRREEEEADGEPDDVAAEAAALGEADEASPREDAVDQGDRDAAGEPDDRQPRVGAPLSMPFARRDLDRLRVILLARRRLEEIHRAPGVRQMLGGRPYLEDALRWIEIHGGPEATALAAHWRGLDMSDLPAPPPRHAHGRGGPADAGRATPKAAPETGPAEGASPGGPRRRRRRRRRRPRPTPAPPA
jgi:poly(A) polymerase